MEIGKINYLPTRNSTYLTSKINDKCKKTKMVIFPHFLNIYHKNGPTKIIYKNLNQNIDNLTFLDNIIKSDAETMTIHVPKIDFGFLRSIIRPKEANPNATHIKKLLPYHSYKVYPKALVEIARSSAHIPNLLPYRSYKVVMEKMFKDLAHPKESNP
ncbi:hypothetical protein Glove_691g10 [Diversispora epigaea]|uniref:Uncharacterized protein n=1 Tax=Diversispora epigaea TaxID=1348612 RepID=A0A397G671_9GLOM|nr:hypothetical protein Glove_691g10 [Diversispora epigaea]